MSSRSRASVSLGREEKLRSTHLRPGTKGSCFSSHLRPVAASSSLSPDRSSRPEASSYHAGSYQDSEAAGAGESSGNAAVSGPAEGSLCVSLSGSTVGVGCAWVSGSGVGVSCASVSGAGVDMGCASASGVGVGCASVSGAGVVRRTQPSPLAAADPSRISAIRKQERKRFINGSVCLPQRIGRTCWRLVHSIICFHSEKKNKRTAAGYTDTDSGRSRLSRRIRRRGAMCSPCIVPARSDRRGGPPRRECTLRGSFRVMQEEMSEMDAFPVS